MTEYSNPRLTAEIPDWPNGRTGRVVARFSVETVKGKQRAVRITTGQPKRLTYSDKVRIVDGDDGRTYIAAYHAGYRMITIMNGDMKFQHEVIFDRDERFAAVFACFQ